MQSWATFETLTFGSYEVKEIAAPGGYKLNDKVFTATVNTKQKDFEFELTNEKEPDMPQPTVPQDIPDTGVESNPTLWFGVLGIAGVCLAVLLVVNRKKKKIKDSE